MKLVTKKAKPRKPVHLIIGEHGVGKTLFCVQSDNPVFLCTEDGASNIGEKHGYKPDFVTPDRIINTDEVVVKDFKEITDCLEKILRHEHEYETLCIDTFNGVIKSLMEFICMKYYKNSWLEFNSWSNGVKACVMESTKIINLLEKINRTRNMSIILTSHTDFHNIRNPRLGEFGRIEGDMPKDIWNVFANWVDIVSHACYQMSVSKKNKTAEKTKIRLLRCGGSAAEDTKCRAGFELPEEMLFSFNNYKEFLGSENTLDKIKKNWDELTSEQQASTLEWLGVGTVDELENVQVGNLHVLWNRMSEVLTQKEEELDSISY